MKSLFLFWMAFSFWFLGELKDLSNRLAPFQVMLSIGGDPTSTYTVTWRTYNPSNQTLARIVKTTADLSFETHADTIQGSDSKAYGDQGNLFTHQVVFDKLEPNTLYAYSVGDGVHWSEWYQFRTAHMDDETFSFLYFGDIQNGIKSHGSRVLRDAYTRFAGKSSFLLFTGDIVERSFDSLWNEYFEAGGWMFGVLPSVSTPGNHEYYKNVENLPRSFSRHWNDIYGFPKNAPSKEYENRFYYFDYQGVRFVSVDSYAMQLDQPDLELKMEWLEKTLASNPHTWTIILTHYPIYSCSSGRNNLSYRKMLEPLFEQYNVDLVLQGHDHTYCRGQVGAKRIQQGNHVSGPVYVVSVSGSKMYSLGDVSWSTIQGEGIPLYQHITVSKAEIKFAAYDAIGNEFDSFIINKDN